MPKTAPRTCRAASLLPASRAPIGELGISGPSLLANYVRPYSQHGVPDPGARADRRTTPARPTIPRVHLWALDAAPPLPRRRPGPSAPQGSPMTAPFFRSAAKPATRPLSPIAGRRDLAWTLSRRPVRLVRPLARPRLGEVGGGGGCLGSLHALGAWGSPSGSAGSMLAGPAPGTFV